MENKLCNLKERCGQPSKVGMLSLEMMYKNLFLKSKKEFPAIYKKLFVIYKIIISAYLSLHL